MQPAGDRAAQSNTDQSNTAQNNTAQNNTDQQDAMPDLAEASKAQARAQRNSNSLRSTLPRAAMGVNRPTMPLMQTPNQ